MWNIIVGNMVLGAFSTVILFIENYVVKNRTANIFIDIFAVIIFTAVCFFLGRCNYKVSLIRLIIILTANFILCCIALLFDSKLFMYLNVGSLIPYFRVLARFIKGETAWIIAAVVTYFIPYILIYTGMLAGRRAHREQYKLWTEADREKRERKRMQKKMRKNKAPGEEAISIGECEK